MSVNKNPQVQPATTNYYQSVQDKHQKTIDTSPYIVFRALAAVGQAFNAAANSLAVRLSGAKPLETWRYHTSIGQGQTKISPVAFAITTNASTKQITQLLDRGCIVDNHAKTAFGTTFGVKGNEEIEKLRKRIDANIVENMESKETPLMASVQLKANRKNLETLLSNGANVNAQDIDGRTALSFACEGQKHRHNLEDIKLLLKSNKINVNLADKTGKTPLMYAVIAEDVLVTELLLKDPRAKEGLSIRNAEGKTVADLAKERAAERKIQDSTETFSQRIERMVHNAINGKDLKLNEKRLGYI